jgi:type IV secretory pathway TraG/TraD family ATPase VirD4
MQIDIFKFFKKESKEEEIFDINLEKGLYFGPGIKIEPGKTDEIYVEPSYVAWGDLASHLAVFGTTRVGKTRLMVSLIRQCILNGMDLLVIEPKGSVGQETIAWVLEFAEEAGRLRDFKYISPMFKDISERFNPLWGLSNEEISSLVSTLIPAKDDFYITMGYTITFAILIGLEFLEKAEGQDKLNELIKEEYKRHELNNAMIIDEENDLCSPDLAERLVSPDSSQPLAQIDPPYRSLVTFADIATYSTQEGLQAILSHVENTQEEHFNTDSQKEKESLRKLKVEAMRALREQAEKDSSYFSKVASSFNITIQQLSTGDLGEILCSTKINPIIDGYRNENHGQIVIVQPFPLKYKKASDAFVRVFFAMFTATMGDIGAAGRRFPRDIAVFIDEGGSVLYPGVEALFNKGGGLGLRIMIFTQSFADYNAELGPDVAKIVNDNTNTKIYMKMNDIDSREEIANAFGKIMEASGNYMGSKLDMRISASNQEKALMTSAHIAKFQPQEFLIQKKEGFYFCMAPFQPDPNIVIEMPKTKTEELYDSFGKEFASKLREQYNFNSEDQE